jgi:hypothetical protein
MPFGGRPAGQPASPSMAMPVRPLPDVRLPPLITRSCAPVRELARRGVDAYPLAVSTTACGSRTYRGTTARRAGAMSADAGGTALGATSDLGAASAPSRAATGALGRKVGVVHRQLPTAYQNGEREEWQGEAAEHGRRRTAGPPRQFGCCSVRETLCPGSDSVSHCWCQRKSCQDCGVWRGRRCQSCRSLGRR